MPLLGPAALPPPQEYGTPHLRQRAIDHVLGGLPAVDAGNRPVGVTGGRRDEAELLQEVVAHLLGHLRRGGRDAQHRVDDRDRVAADERARDRGQRGIPCGVPVAGAARSRAPRVRDPSSPPGRRWQPLRAVRPADRPRVPTSCGPRRAWPARRRARPSAGPARACCDAERLLRLRQRRHRGLLAGFRVGDRRVGVLLGQPRGRLLVDLLGARALKIGDDLLRARPPTSDRPPRWTGCRRGRGGQVGIRRPVDIRCGREGVEPLLRGGDRGVGVDDRAARWRPLLAARRRRCRAPSGRRRWPC